MPKLLVKKRDGSVHIREKSKESADNLEDVHPNKVRSWLALAEASISARGKTMEDVIQSVLDEMSGKKFKANKPKIQVTPREYSELMRQCMNKSVSRRVLDNLVEVVEPQEGAEVEEVVITND